MWQGHPVRRRSPRALSFALVALFALPAAVTAAAPAGSYDRAAADEDLRTVLHGSGREYIAARGRLSDHPQLAREVALAALEALDARVSTLQQGGAYSQDSASYAEIETERSRLIAVLAESKDPADAPRFGQRLRAVLERSDTVEDWRVMLDPWRPLLLGLGPAAAPEFAALVADTKLRAEQREFFLQDLVAVTSADQLPSLCAQLGRGDLELERALRRGLLRRTREDAQARDSVLGALDQQIADADTPAPTRAASLLLRHSVTGVQGDDQPYLLKTALDDGADFSLRAAALLILAETPTPLSELESLAKTHLAADKVVEQQSELLAWLALNALPLEQRAQFDADYGLRQSPSPRLASVGWASATLAPAGEWLDQGLAHAWPEVRRGAVERIDAGCGNAPRKRLRTLAGPQSEGGDADEQFARSAIRALGRCGDIDGLRGLVESDGIGFERRGVAAKQLVRHDPGGPLLVAALLGTNIDPHLGEQFATALGETPPQAVDPKVVQALCRAESTNPTAAMAARRSRKAIAPETACSTP